MPDLWTDLLGCLQLRAQDGERPDASDISVFEGNSQRLNYHRVFGGQLLGQFIRTASLSHTIWFHRPFRTDRWLLLRQHSPMLAHGRCFGRRDVLTEDGSLVASYGQEALLRFRDAGDRIDP